MASSLLHPIGLEAIEPPLRMIPRIGQMAGLAALVIGVIALGLALA